MAAKKKSNQPKDPNAIDRAAARRKRKPLTPEEVAAAKAPGTARTPRPVRENPNKPSRKTKPAANTLSVEDIRNAPVPVVTTTEELATPADVNRIVMGGAVKRAKEATKPKGSGRKTKTQELISLSEALAQPTGQPADIVDLKAKDLTPLETQGPTEEDVRRAARFQATDIGYDGGDEDLADVSFVGGMEVDPTGRISGGSIATSPRGRKVERRIEYGVDENDPYATAAGTAAEISGERQEELVGLLGVMRDEPRTRTAEEEAQATRVYAAEAARRRESRIAGARYTKTRIPARAGGDVMGVMKERAGIASDVPSESTTVESLQRRQHFFMEEPLDEGAKPTRSMDWLIRTGNPPLTKTVTADPSKPSGMRVDLVPASTELSRESLDRTYIANTNDWLQDALRVKNMVSAIDILDSLRASQPRVFDPSSAQKEPVSEEIVLGEHLNEPAQFKVTKRRTGSMVRPSRRQVLAELKDTDPKQWANLKEALAATRIAGPSGQKGISRVLNMSGSTEMSPQFLGAIGELANIYNTNLRLSQSEAGRQQLLESGARIVEGERNKVGGLPLRYGGIPTIEGLELGPYSTSPGEGGVAGPPSPGKGILDEDVYKQEAARVAASPDVGFSVTPLRPASRREQRFIRGPRPAVDPASILPTEESAEGASAQERLDTWAAAAAPTVGGLDSPQFKAAREAIIAASAPRLALAPVTKSVDRTINYRDEPLRNVVNRNWAGAAAGRRALAIAADVPGVQALIPRGEESGKGTAGTTTIRRGGKFTSDKAALIEGGEGRLREDLEKNTMQPPVSGAAEGGDALRAPDMSDLGLGTEFTTVNGAIVLRSRTWGANPRRDAPLGRGAARRFMQQKRPLYFAPPIYPQSKETAYQPLQGPIPPFKQVVNPVADLMDSGFMEPVKILPGGRIGAIAGVEPTITEAHPLFGKSSAELEAMRIAAFQRTPRSPGETSLPNPPIPDNQRKFTADIRAGVLPMSDEEIAAGRQRIADMRAEPVNRVRPGQIMGIPGSVGADGQWRPDVHSSGTPDLRTVRSTVEGASTMAMLRRGGEPGVLLRSNRIRRFNPTSGTWESVEKSQVNNPIQFGNS